MKEYTFGKKAVAVVLHQMCMILSMCCLYTSDYYHRNRLPEHGGLITFFCIAGLLGTFVLLAYLTMVVGQKNSEDKEIGLHKIDYVYGDFFCLVFLLLCILVGNMALRLSLPEFSLAGIIVTAGCITYVADIVFMIFYLSIVRRTKADILISQTFICRLYQSILQKKQAKGKGIHVAFSRKGREQQRLQEAVEKIAEGTMDLFLDVDEFHGKEREIAIAINNIGNGLAKLVEESIRNERMKADLITNVSHDIKTPLTSIVNYVELLKRENLDNERAREYIRILEEKSQRLKQLTEDLVEASKISSGNVKLDMQTIDFVELLYQTGGEFNERFEARELTIVTKLPNTAVMIRADGRQLYRTVENLYTNAAKYALEKTRVYVELAQVDNRAVFTIKNVSKTPIDSSGATDLTERFVRGEVSRTTEGSGLGLSIAKNLTQLMGGSFKVQADGDLFIAEISFEMA